MVKWCHTEVQNLPCSLFFGDWLSHDPHAAVTRGSAQVCQDMAQEFSNQQRITNSPPAG